MVALAHNVPQLTEGGLMRLVGFARFWLGAVIGCIKNF